jgi:hypothetical protein
MHRGWFHVARLGETVTNRPHIRPSYLGKQTNRNGTVAFWSIGAYS